MFGDIVSALRTVLSSPERLRALFAAGPSTAADLVRFMTRIVPISAANLEAIRERAAAIPDPQHWPLLKWLFVPKRRAVTQAA